MPVNYENRESEVTRKDIFHCNISFDLTRMHANTNYNQAEEHNPNYTRKLRVTFRYNLS